MPRPAGIDNHTSVGVYRRRRGSQDTESIMLAAFGDQPKRPSESLSTTSISTHSTSLSSSPSLDVSSLASSWKAVAFPASTYIRQLVPRLGSQTLLQVNPPVASGLDTEDDIGSLFGGQVLETTSGSDDANDEEEHTAPAIQLTSFRRMSRTPFPTLAPSLTTGTDSDPSDTEETKDFATEFVLPASSSQIVTRKIIQTSDGRYRLQTSIGPVHFVRPDGTSESESTKEGGSLEDELPDSKLFNPETSSLPEHVSNSSSSTTTTTRSSVITTPPRSERGLSGRVVHRAVIDYIRRPVVSVHPSGSNTVDGENIERATTAPSKAQLELYY